jgi:hypothetical protein
MFGKTLLISLPTNIMDFGKIYEFIQMNLFYGDETLTIREKRYNPLIVFSIITSILNGRELILGEYGSGKTTSAERISSITKYLPLEFVQSATIHGHPEQTEEKIKATLDLGALEREGKEVIKWKLLPFSPTVIIDEVNRLPVGKQSLILNEIDRNIWCYRGESIFTGEKSFFGTINYQDSGTTKLIPPLLDRFDISVETSFLHPVRKRLLRRGIDDGVLRDPDLSMEMIDYILYSTSEKVKEIERYVREVSESFREELQERMKRMNYTIYLPDLEEIGEVRREIQNYPVSYDFELFFDYIGQEVYCQLGLNKDFSKCYGCHYTNLVCSDMFSISNRAERSTFLYAKALAWWNGDEEADLDHLLTVMPFTLSHRTAISDKKLSEVREKEKDVGDEFFAVKDSIDRVKRRWEEHRIYQISALNFLKDGDYEKIEEIAELTTHPYFRNLLRS